MLFKARTAVIEFVGDEVRVAVAKVGGALPTVLELVTRQAVYEAPEQRFEALVNALGEAVDSLKHRPATYVLCVSCLFGVVRTLTIPFRGRRRVSAAVRFELEPYLAFPIEELLVDFDIVGEFDGETEVLVMGLRRAALEEALAVVREAGLDVDGVNLDAAGLTALWQGVSRKTKGLNAVLHARSANAMVAVTYNGSLAYFRNLTFNAEYIRDNPTAAAREVQNSLRAFITKWRGAGEITALDVTGLGFTDEQRAAFAETMRMPVEEVDLLGRLKGGPGALREAGEADADNHWAAGLGVALSAAGGPYGFDFTRTDQSWQSYTPGAIKHVMFSSCLALLLLVGWAFYYHQGTIRNRAEAAAMQVRADELSAEIEALGEKGLGSEVDTRVFSVPTLLTLLDEVSQKLPADKVTVTELKMSPPEAKSWWIRIQGTVSDAGVFTEVFNQLKTSPIFRVEEDADLSLQGELTTFAIKIFRPDTAEETDSSAAPAAQEAQNENQS
jgi:hypothetical protein